MKKVSVICPAIVLFFLTACKPGYYPCDAAPEVTVDTVNGIFEGETLYLKATGTQGVSYKWSGPEGYSSTEQNPIINSVSFANEGVYRVIVEKDGCVSSAGFELKVNAKPPCTPANNVINFNNTNYVMTNAKMTINPSTGYGTVTANHPATFSTITISQIIPNKTNVYFIDQSASDPNEVSVEFYEGSPGRNWTGADSKAYVRMINGKPEITICNSTFVSFSLPSRKVTCKITVP
jgi:hypothetical protein